MRAWAFKCRISMANNSLVESRRWHFVERVYVHNCGMCVCLSECVCVKSVHIHVCSGCVCMIHRLCVLEKVRRMNTVTSCLSGLNGS